MDQRTINRVTNESRDEDRWKTLSRNTIYDNPWITVEHNDVINPNGDNGIYGKVKFKNYAIGILPIDDDNNTWLVGQNRYTLNDYSWEIPMGGGPLNIDPLVSAQRELQEETGITALEWDCLMKLHTSNCVTDELGYVYTAKNLSFGETCFDNTEKLKIKKLALKEVYAMVMDGDITDAISVAGILKYHLLMMK